MPTSTPAALYHLLYYMQTLKIKLFFLIPDVMFVDAGQVGAHFFTGKNGEILRRQAINVNSEEICGHFLHKALDGRYNFEKYVGLVHDDPPVLLKEPQFIELANKLIHNETTPGARADDYMIIQLYIKPKNDLGYEICVVRRGDSMWVHHSTFRYSRRYRSKKERALQERLDSEYERGMEVFHPVPGVIANEAERLTALMLRYMWKIHSNLDVLCCEFILNYSGKLYLHRMSNALSAAAKLAEHELPPL